ncbi:MAG: hypothetical protein AAB309_01740, partial [Deltaproteobacteria bacterium]
MDINNEYFQAIKHAGIFDLSKQCFKISGQDARDFINRILTNNIKDLKGGFGSYNCLCDKKGKMLADLYCYAAGDFFIIACSKSLTDKIRDILKRYIIIEAVQIEEPLLWNGVAVIGPEAESLLTKSSLKIPMDELQFVEMMREEHPLSIIRKKYWGLDGFEIWGEEKTLLNLKKEWPDPISEETQEILRIESKTPLYGVDIISETIPQEADLYSALDFNKGCYIGQETIARLEHRGHVNKKLSLLKLSGNRLPDAGIRILTKEGEDAGYVTSSCYS